RRKQLELSLSVVAESLNKIVGDQARLKQVLINLICNAVKFTEAGRVEVSYTVDTEVRDGKRQFTFSVADTGIGIPDDKKDLLFRTFSQVEDSHSRSYGGTGLGLAISREIVGLMGGSISFTSVEGTGSTFYFSILLGEAGPVSDALAAVDTHS